MEEASKAVGGRMMAKGTPILRCAIWGIIVEQGTLYPLGGKKIALRGGGG